MNSGYVDATIYVVLSAISFVFLNKLCDQVAPLIALFTMSGIALICFNVLSICSLKKTYAACIRHKYLFLLMSAALGIDWLGMLSASRVADPFISMAALFIALAFSGFAKLYIKQRSYVNLISMLLLFASIIILYFSYQLGQSQHIGEGLLLGTIAGMAFFVYMESSGVLAEQGNLSSIQLLATRFWVLFVGSSLLIPYKNLYTAVAPHFLPLAMVSMGTLVVPIFFNQQAIKKLGTALTAVLISFVPSTTYLVYAIYNHHFILSNTVACGIITLALILPKIVTVINVSSNCMV